MSVVIRLLVVAVLVVPGCVTTVEAPALVPPGEPAAVVIAPPADDLFALASVGALGALEKYLAQSDLITSEGGSLPERMTSLVTSGWYPREREGFARYSSASERTLGATRIEGLQVQLARRTPEGLLDIGVIGCVDSTTVLILGLEDPDPPPEVLKWQGEWESFDGSDDEWQVIESYWATSTARWGQRAAVVFWLVGESTEKLLVDHSEQWWGISRC
jgi:hypothetical protein